jgi:hypothetical protein
MTTTVEKLWKLRLGALDTRHERRYSTQYFVNFAHECEAHGEYDEHLKAKIPRRKTQNIGKTNTQINAKINTPKIKKLFSSLLF